MKNVFGMLLMEVLSNKEPGMESREFRLKEGDDLVCEVSGVKEKALIKFQTEFGETPWMGMQALKKAWKILAPIAGEEPEISKSVPQHYYQTAPVQHQQNILMEAPPPPPPQTRQGPQTTAQRGPLSQAEIRDLEAFQLDLVDLLANPPPMNDKGSDESAVGEMPLRRLISDHQGRFRDPFTLFPVLRHHIPEMNRERFQQILEMNKRRA